MLTDEDKEALEAIRRGAEKAGNMKACEQVTGLLTDQIKTAAPTVSMSARQKRLSLASQNHSPATQ